MSALAAWLGDSTTSCGESRCPQCVSAEALTIGGIISALVAIGTMLLAGALGGMRGERYHRRADAAIAGTGDGGVSSGIES